MRPPIASTRIRRLVLHSQRDSFARSARSSAGRSPCRRGREGQRRRPHVLPVKVGRRRHYLRSHGRCNPERVGWQRGGAKQRRMSSYLGADVERLNGRSEVDSEAAELVRVGCEGQKRLRCFRLAVFLQIQTTQSSTVCFRGRELNRVRGRCSSTECHSARGRASGSALALCHSRDPQNARPLLPEYSLETPSPYHSLSTIRHTDSPPPRHSDDAPSTRYRPSPESSATRTRRVVTRPASPASHTRGIGIAIGEIAWASTRDQRASSRGGRAGAHSGGGGSRGPGSC